MTTNDATVAEIVAKRDFEVAKVISGYMDDFVLRFGPEKAEALIRELLWQANCVASQAFTRDRIRLTPDHEIGLIECVANEWFEKTKETWSTTIPDSIRELMNPNQAQS